MAITSKGERRNRSSSLFCNARIECAKALDAVKTFVPILKATATFRALDVSPPAIWLHAAKVTLRHLIKIVNLYSVGINCIISFKAVFVRKSTGG
ncbi:hypothetical protein PsorP6_009946 [Peronosclerospora sorghi]|uniref:Uncharacterized protein n=1 Tax=Peronosclerospora sorghi TaxID=230839 RepID=A0ACC0VW82_9STRA|nr:hypothetical protein PsorP6_009946 [Peronosclerospora sorghi]